jgi:hypothetical protein
MSVFLLRILSIIYLVRSLTIHMGSALLYLHCAKFFESLAGNNQIYSVVVPNIFGNVIVNPPIYLYSTVYSKFLPNISGFPATLMEFGHSVLKKIITPENYSIYSCCYLL